MASKKRKRRYFSPEYKAEVVALMRKSGKTPGQVARDLALTETSVRAWLRQAEVGEGKGPEPPVVRAPRAGCHLSGSELICRDSDHDRTQRTADVLAACHLGQHRFALQKVAADTYSAQVAAYDGPVFP